MVQELEKKLKEILFCKKCLKETISLWSHETIEYVKGDKQFMYFAISSENKPSVFYRVDDDMDTFKLENGEWKYIATI
ncbi:hypothetical protein [Bacillus thuringiensis]|uniref:Uncharacterized protein n=1 Tax=Bacillus thuringiensis TaxID=1428 RepID=A0A9X6VCX0_BACTU|nr:hypothetical protein [Bacillus thuringiensis]MEC3270603.1 hypothetical protein [Bacillus thuringiensis]PFB08166.1 hypothetical protein CN398_10655 [Bacillus thuringiensis]